MSTLHFGTDGWRGIIGADFTRENVERAARAYVAFVHSRGAVSRGVVLGYDRRFLSERMAAHVATVLADGGIPVWLAASACTTPAVSRAVHGRSAFGGIVVTASHNPPEFNGLKFKAEFGGSASSEDVADIAARIDQRVPSDSRDRISRPDIQDEHRQHLSETVPARSALRRLRVVVDPMHGAASGLATGLLRDRGHDVVEIRGEENPAFGGVSPEPIPPHTDALAEAVRTARADIGIALDGDGDRIGAVDALGDYFSPQRIIALLTVAALSGGERGRIVKTVSTTALLDRVCRDFDVAVDVTPIGFKYVCAEILKGDVLVAGEESGGLWTRGGIPERDGVRIALILTDILASDPSPLHDVWDRIARQYGRFEYRRRDRYFDRSHRSAVEEAAESLEVLGGVPVRERDLRDGVKLVREDDSWLMFRFSGTEPVLRLYAEAGSVQECEALLDDAELLVGSLV